MNEFLRLLNRLVVRPQGYRIIRSGQVHLRPVKGLTRLHGHESLAAAQALFDQEPPADGAASPPRALTVHLRTCLRGERRRRLNPVAERPQEDAVLACVASLVDSVNHLAGAGLLDDLRVEALDDRSDPEARARIETVLGLLSVPWTLETPEETLAGPVMHGQFRRAAGADRMLYFVEDDYLHVPEALTAMVAVYQQLHALTGGPLLLHPQEQRVLYRHLYPSYVIEGADRRWRTTQHMSHTLFTHGHVLRDHWDCFENTRHVGHAVKRKAHKGAERNTTNRLFDRLPGFCPMPALAAHFQAPELLPPFFDWRPLFDAYRPADHDIK